MVFIFILDVIASLTLSVAVSCSKWIIYKSANGIYYIYKKIKPNPHIEIPDNSNENELIILTREEYDSLTKHQDQEISESTQ
jgi:hypothetical protein